VRSAPDVRIQLTLGLRAVNHVVLAVRAVGRPGSRGRSLGWLAAGAASLAADLALARRLRDPGYLPGWPQWLLGWVDTAVWAHATDSRMDVMPLVVANGLTSAAEAGMDGFAGTTAIPVYNPDRPWPPAGAGDAARRGARVVATATVPVLITGIVRRRRGLPPASEHLLWSGVGAALGIYGIRHRDRLHRAERRRWQARTAAQVDQELDAARATLALMSSPGHDFKKTLFALGFHGSKAALEEAYAQTDHPSQLFGHTGGQTLFQVTRPHRLIPAEAATRWLSNRQADEVDTFLSAAEDRAVEGADQSVRVVGLTADETVIEYLGQRLVLRNEPPPLSARLRLTSFLLAAGAFHALDTVFFRELPWQLVAPSVAVLGTGAWRFWRRPPAPDELGAVLWISTAATAWGMAASASRRVPLVAPFGHPADPAAAFAKAYLYVLAAHWSRLSPAQRLLLPATLAGWVGANLRRSRTPAQLIVGFLELLVGVVCAWRGNDLLDGEAVLLERELQDEFTRACERARRRATGEELDRYRHQLDVARGALRELAAQLTPAEHRELEHDCDELARWLTAQDARLT
jgi:hypothetical protein